VDWKAEYSAFASTRSQKKKLKQPLGRGLGSAPSPENFLSYSPKMACFGGIGPAEFSYHSAV